MEPPVPSFEDPVLKAALRRAIPKERAPEGLRQRISALTSAASVAESGSSLRLTDRTESTAQAPPRSIPLFRRQWVKLAAAAVFAIAAVLTALFIHRQSGSAADPNSPYVIANSVYKGMVKVHEERKNGLAPPDTVNALAAAGPTLSKSLGRPVFAPDLTREGWTFVGGAVRKVGPFDAAQLYFTKGKASLSVLSLPASAANQAKEGSTYDINFQGTPIAGFVKKGGLFCIVGQGQDQPLTTRDVKSLLLEHRDEVVKA